MEWLVASRGEQAGLSHLGGEVRSPRLPLGVAALVVALLSGGLWLGLLWVLDSLF